MAFFDDLGKKISQAGQTAVQKTKDMTDIARINAAISDEEDKIKNTYLQLGQLYYEAHQEDPDAQFPEQMAMIMDAKNNIEAMQKQIKEIKGVVCCQQCGAELPANVLFCSVCGTPAPKKPEPPLDPNFVKCQSCGAVESRNSRFCSKCGSEIVIPEPEEAPATAKCAACGAEVDPTLPFCTSCGARVN